MSIQTLIVTAIIAIGVAGAIWLTPLGGLVTGGAAQITQAPDQDQGPKYSRDTQTEPANTGAARNNVQAQTRQRTADAARPQPRDEPDPEPQPRYTTDSTVNVRSGAGTDFGVAGQVDPGEKVTLVEDPGGNWIRIRGQNVDGWVYRPLFDKVEE